MIGGMKKKMFSVLQECTAYVSFSQGYLDNASARLRISADSNGGIRDFLLQRECLKIFILSE
jgi:hypothetical protein